MCSVTLKFDLLYNLWFYVFMSNAPYEPMEINQLVPNIDTEHVAAGTDHLSIVVELCQETGLPYPIENNPKYSSWWHALHEVGHFAVLTPGYRRIGSMLMGITTKTVLLKGGSEFPSGPLNVYLAGNDVLPSLFEPNIVLPYELETRTWCLEVLKKLDLPHPMNSPDFRSKQSASVWHPRFAREQTGELLLEKLEAVGVNVSDGNYASTDESLFADTPLPRNGEEMVALHGVMIDWYDAQLATVKSKGPRARTSPDPWPSNHDYWAQCMNDVVFKSRL